MDPFSRYVEHHVLFPELSLANGLLTVLHKATNNAQELPLLPGSIRTCKNEYKGIPTLKNIVKLRNKGLCILGESGCRFSLPEASGALGAIVTSRVPPECLLGLLSAFWKLPG